MTNNRLLQVFLSTLIVGSAVSPAFALDYEAKPIKWCIEAPVRLVAGLAGGIATGGVSQPIDDGYHWALKGTKHVAGEFGDEKGAGQLAAGAAIGGPAGLVLGAARGVPYGFLHGFKKGWAKPFSRWSFLTMEEK